MVLGWCPFRILSDDPPGNQDSCHQPTLFYLSGKCLKISSETACLILTKLWCYMVLKWSYFRIISDFPARQPRWSPSADIILTEDPMGKMFKILHFWNCLASWEQTSVEWSFGGYFSQLYLMTPPLIQDGHHQPTLFLYRTLYIGKMFKNVLFWNFMDNWETIWCNGSYNYVWWPRFPNKIADISWHSFLRWGCIGNMFWKTPLKSLSLIEWSMTPIAQARWHHSFDIGLYEKKR